MAVPKRTHEISLEAAYAAPKTRVAGRISKRLNMKNKLPGRRKNKAYRACLRMNVKEDIRIQEPISPMIPISDEKAAIMSAKINLFSIEFCF